MAVKQEKTTNNLKKQYNDCLLLCKFNLSENRGKNITELIFLGHPGSTVKSLLEFVVTINRISMKVLILFNTNYRLISNNWF